MTTLDHIALLLITIGAFGGVLLLVYGFVITILLFADYVAQHATRGPRK